MSVRSFCSHILYGELYLDHKHHKKYIDIVIGFDMIMKTFKTIAGDNTTLATISHASDFILCTTLNVLVKLDMLSSQTGS